MLDLCHRGRRSAAALKAEVTETKSITKQLEMLRALWLDLSSVTPFAGWEVLRGTQHPMRSRPYFFPGRSGNLAAPRNCAR